MAYYIPVSEKTIIKWNRELVELHKRVIKTYLASMGVKYSTQHKFFRLYDYFIDECNIRSYFHTPTPILVQGLVRGEVDRVSTNIFRQTKKSHGKHKRRTN